MFDSDDGKLDLCTFTWFRDIYDTCTPDSFRLLALIQDEGSIGYETDIKRERKYSTHAYSKLLHKERMEYMDKLHQLDLLRERSKQLSWAESVKGTLYKFCDRFNISIEEAIELLNTRAYGCLVFDDRVIFIRLNHYRYWYSGDRLSAKYSFNLNFRKKVMTVHMAYFSDETWTVRACSRVSCIDNEHPEADIIGPDKINHRISASFLISPKMKTTYLRF